MARKLRCPQCRKRFAATRPDRKFCSPKCCYQFNALAYYYSHKHLKSFKDKQRANFERWRTENREHFNALVRPKAKAWNKKRFDFRKRNRLCIYCGIKLKDSFTACLECRKSRRKYYR